MKKRIIYILLILMPIIDLITALQTRSGVLFSFGMVIKGIISLFSVIYVFFASASKYKKISIAYILAIILFVVLYFALKPDLININYLKPEITYLFRIFYMPIVFCFCINYFDEFGFNKNHLVKTLAVVLCEYSILLLVPFLFNLAYESYSTGLGGYVGWYYAANEVSVIMILLLPFMYFLFTKKYSFMIAMPIIYIVSCIGTKVTFLGILVVSFLSLVYYLIKNKFRLNNYIRGACFVILYAVLILFFIERTTINNIKELNERQNQPVVEALPSDQEIEPIQIDQDFENEVAKLHNKTDNNNFISLLLSSRDEYYILTKAIYKLSFQKSYILYGMGFSNTNRINNNNIEKLIEIDFLDLYFHIGVIGLIVVLIPYLYVCFKVISSLFKKQFFKNDIIYFWLIVLLGMSIAAIAGHVLFYPAVSIYLVFYLTLILNELEVFEKKPINNRKIAILALHLKPGGIETVITNQANMLADDYHVEIITLYKSKNTYKLNKNVKVTYLMNTISNREELISAFKKINFFKFIRESFKSLKILYLKPLLIKKAIINSDAKVIISSRKEFSKILGKYHREGVVTISEEHVYHNNNKKYIKNVIKDNYNVDYLLPTSKELTDFYKDRVKADVKYIPNVINYFPNSLNSLKNNRILAIGRLSKEKGFLSLVEVMKYVTKKNKNVILDIYGDGPDREIIKKSIKDNNLEKNILLKGFVSYDELNIIRKDYDLILCSSYEEAFGLAVLESMAFGIPCITFDDAKGIQEFVNNDNGVIISNRDTKKMANSILALMSNNSKIKKLAKNARNMAENYSYDIVKTHLLLFVDNAIKESKNKNRKVLFVASSGGHLNELMQLEKLFNRYDFSIITEKTGTTKALKNKYRKRCSFLLFGTKHNLIKYLLWVCPINCILSIYYYFYYKPQYIISTGAHTAGPICLLGKIFNSKIIYIESFANINTKSITGSIVYHFADTFIVQWPEMRELYPNAIYKGGVY